MFHPLLRGVRLYCWENRKKMLSRRKKLPLGPRPFLMKWFVESPNGYRRSIWGESCLFQRGSFFGPDRIGRVVPFCLGRNCLGHSSPVSVETFFPADGIY